MTFRIFVWHSTGLIEESAFLPSSPRDPAMRARFSFNLQATSELPRRSNHSKRLPSTAHPVRAEAPQEVGAQGSLGRRRLRTLRHPGSNWNQANATQDDGDKKKSATAAGRAGARVAVLTSKALKTSMLETCAIEEMLLESQRQVLWPEGPTHGPEVLKQTM